MSENTSLEELANELTFQQELFCREYIANGENGTRAAEAAGYGTTDASRASQAYSLLKRPHIHAYIRALKDEQLRALHLSPDHLLAELAKIAGFNIGDILRVDHSGVPYVDLTGVERAHTAALQAVKTKETKRKRGENLVDIQEIEVKAYDKLRAIELLMQHAGMLKPQTQVNVQINADFGERMAARRLKALED